MAKMIKNAPERFTSLSNKIVRDDSLSWKARGIFLYLYSQADDWDFYETEVANHSTDGRDSLRSGLKELEDKGYIKRTRFRNEKGQLMSSDWMLSDYPMFEKPMFDFPTQVTRTLSNTNLSNTNTSKTNSNKDIVLQGENATLSQSSRKNVVQNKDEKTLSGSNEQDGIPYKEIVDYLNAKTGKKYKSGTGATKKFIHARFKEGNTVDDFKKVIDNMTAKWLGTTQEEYLRPATLFSPSKFEGYLNADPTKRFGEFNNGKKREAVTPNAMRQKPVEDFSWE